MPAGSVALPSGSSLPVLGTYQAPPSPSPSTRRTTIEEVPNEEDPPFRPVSPIFEDNNDDLPDLEPADFTDDEDDPRPRKKPMTEDPKTFWKTRAYLDAVDANFVPPRSPPPQAEDVEMPPVDSAASTSYSSSTSASLPAKNPWSFHFSGDSDYDGDSGEEDTPDFDDNNLSDAESEEEASPEPQPEIQRTPPTIEEAREALKALARILRPPHDSGAGYKDPKLDLLTRTRYKWLKSFLHIYSSDNRPIGNRDAKAARWMAASLEAAHAAQKGPWLAQRLREWARYGTWNHTLLEDEDVAAEIALHLQSIGKYVKAMDIVHFIDSRPDLKQKIKRKKEISLAMAQRWMKRMGYRWMKNPSGQFVDGHERDNIVYYCQTEFLPAFTRLEYQTRKWTLDNLDLIRTLPENQVNYTMGPFIRKSGTASQGRGRITDGFGLRSKDKSDATRVLFKAGKNWEGYFTNEDILKQTRHAMDILQHDYPDEKHVFVFDNATTHTKRADDALSARNMPRFTPKEGKPNWLLTVNKFDANGKRVYTQSGQLAKTKVPMRDFPAWHPRGGISREWQ
ncbi:hypothetical protein B0H17DRAFT_1210803 [Mycena rosella]|uniref:Uncharacterized protein n=1 Tax=Mycena rosella TaxID=1033263 RepID=A0AAD7G493_MYCRO|nr:hypothetical protein B0H17DRAFT_1210803 [Mycena rosella]